MAENPYAFPRELPDIHPASPDEAYASRLGHSGMTLRDYFAAAALQGLLADLETRMDAAGHARKAYEYADAMLAERAGRS